MPTIKELHPTFKACKCGMIGTKTQFYSHMKQWEKHYPTTKDFFAAHGEVPLDIDDPRTSLSAALALTLEQHDRRKKIVEEL